MTTPLGPARIGLCLCGRPLLAHYGRRNEFVSCDTLAERDAARAAAGSCTTHDAAHQIVTHDQFLREGRF